MPSTTAPASPAAPATTHFDSSEPVVHIDLSCLRSWADQLLDALKNRGVHDSAWFTVRSVCHEIVQCHEMALGGDVVLSLSVQDADDSPTIRNDGAPAPSDNVETDEAAISKRPRSSSLRSRSSKAVPSGKTRPDVVTYPAIDMDSAHQLPKHMQWFPYAVDEERRRTFNPKRKGAAMPKVDVVVAKGDVYYFAAGWLAFLVDVGRFAEYGDARDAMNKAIGKFEVLDGTGGDDEGLDAIKAGNKGMWMVTEAAFLKHLSRDAPATRV